MVAYNKVLRLSVLFGAALLPATASAYSFQDWLNQKTLTGNWNGGRTRLEQAGIDVTGSYVGEFASDISGGKRRGSDYAEQWGLGATLDTDKLFGLPGGTINVSFTFRQGRSTSNDYVGNEQQVQEIYGAGETTRITELSYDQALFANKLNVKLGFFPFGNDFAHMTYGCDFQNDAFCSHPSNLPFSSGWADSPQGRLGGRLQVNITPNLYVETGVFDSNPTYTQSGNGLKIGTSGSTGAIIPVEIGYQPHFGVLPGHLKAGFYYDTSSAKDVVNTSTYHDGRYGWYVMADQMLFSFDGTAKRGLAAFATVSYSDPMTATYRGTILGGLVAQGPFAVRPNDFIDLGYTRAVLNNRLVNAKEQAPDSTYEDLSTGEGVIEAGYGLQLTPWLLFHPNVQYVINPGTFSYNRNLPNAWVFGAQLKGTL